MEQHYTNNNTGLHYDLELEIVPQKQQLSVKGSIAYHSPLNRLERARFYLHSQFTIRRLEGKRILGYHFEPLADSLLPHSAHAASLDVYFTPPLRMNETVLIKVEYSGIITKWPAESANMITPDWVELGYHLPWYPFQYDGQPSNLSFSVRVNTPTGYQVSSLGKPEKSGDTWFFNWPHQTNDIVIAAGRNMQTYHYESDTNQVYLSTSRFSQQTSAMVGEDALWILERFSGWFGPTRPHELALIISPRKMGGGYAHRGIIVLAGIEEQDYLNRRHEYLRYLGHEAAHTWWWEAPTNTWEDWLNESFAEYSALLAVRERLGIEVFENILSDKGELSDEIRPIWGFPRDNISSPGNNNLVERLLYDKGPLLLDKLAHRINRQRFLELCRGCLWSGVTDTSHLLDLLEELEGTETRDWFEHLLKR